MKIQPRTQKMYYSGKDQETKLQRSIRSKRDKEKQDGKTKLQSRRVRKRKDSISQIDRSQSKQTMRHKLQKLTTLVAILLLD